MRLLQSAALQQGLGTAAGALFGGHANNLAATTAAIMARPEAHPDKEALGLGAEVATALVAAAPTGGILMLWLGWGRRR